MSLPVTRFDFTQADFDRFRAAITRRLGLQFEDARLGFLGDALQRRLDRHACSGAAYLRLIEEGTDVGELRTLARELTVGETYFFRHNDQFRALAEAALPDLMQTRSAARSLRLLSAGCASGEEAYSLAIVAEETVRDPSWKITIRGIDVNPDALAKAGRARYSPWSLRETPPQTRSKWFRSDRRDVVLVEALHEHVEFIEANLVNDDPELWWPAAYDVIFCRNVLMYFAPDQMRAVIRRIAGALSPGGYLFLGHAETLRGISEAFSLCQTHGTFYYRRTGSAPAAQRSTNAATGPGAVDAGAAAVMSMPLPGLALSGDWVDTIRQANERVATLMTKAPVAAAQTSARQPGRDWQLAPVFDLLRNERFREALDYVVGGPPTANDDADVLLIKAVLLAQDGQYLAARDVCGRLLAVDGLNAGAHYVLALCHEHAGDVNEAFQQDRLAAHLDPAFAMPRLHCGLLLRRAGDRDAARREFAQALFLLKQEDAARLLLFGGGFSRDALVALCQSAAADHGKGHP